jgi:hypothetical protein
VRDVGIVFGEEKQNVVWKAISNFDNILAIHGSDIATPSVCTVHSSKPSSHIKAYPRVVITLVLNRGAELVE